MTPSKQILVIGAGTTGLTLACELARHGAPVRIVDKLPGIVHTARATSVHSRTLEVFQDLGIVDEIVAGATPIRGTNQFAGGELILHIRLDGLDSPYPFVASLEQWKIEQALERLLRELGVEVERETELVSLEEYGDAVGATLRKPDGSPEVLETPWLIGCDGAHSTVRHLKGEHFPGDADPRQYLVGDVMFDDGLDTDEAFVFMTDDGVLWQFPLPGGRSLVAGDVAERHGPGETPEIADIQALVDERAPQPVTVTGAHWLSWFHISYRLTPHYRHGRTFLAGDAAHIHSLVGGQGMNTGIQDAYNLGWKLALVGRGRAPKSLLDSYEFERHAVAEDVLATTRALTEKAEKFVMLSPEARARLYRYMVLPETERRQMIRHSEELDLDYRKSPICTDAIGGADGLHAGVEVRDARPLRVNGADTSLFELLRGSHHTLLLVPERHSTATEDLSSFDRLAGEIKHRVGDLVRSYIARPANAEAAGLKNATVVIDTEGALRSRYGAATGRTYLIRPDGYIGFRGQPGHWPALMGHLEGIFS